MTVDATSSQEIARSIAALHRRLDSIEKSNVLLEYKADEAAKNIAPWWRLAGLVISLLCVGAAVATAYFYSRSEAAFLEAQVDSVEKSQVRLKHDIDKVSETADATNFNVIKMGERLNVREMRVPRGYDNGD